MPSANGFARRERSTRRVDRPARILLSGGISRLGRCLPPLRHYDRRRSSPGTDAMTKARARAADDEGDDLSSPSDPVLACLGPVRPAPRELHCSPAAADGTPACKLFMRGKACKADCAYAHDPPSLRQPCWTFERYGVCPRDVRARKRPGGDPVLVPAQRLASAFDSEKPEKQPASRPAVRAGRRRPRRARCRDLLGADAVVDAARLNLARAADCVVFVRSARWTIATRKEGSFDATTASASSAAARALARDPHLLATLKRAYCVSVDGVAPRTRTARVRSRSRETRARACCARCAPPSPSFSAASPARARRRRETRRRK